MKILIVGCFDLYLHPYAEKYISVFKENNVDFKFIYWNRSGNEVPQEDFYLPFNYSMNTFTSIWHKIKGYIKYRKFVMHYLKSNEFDKVVFLATQSMFIFSGIALKKYSKRYIFDYRDETYEKYGFYRKRVSKCITNSEKTVLSSMGFKVKFPEIPDDHFIMCHNTKKNFGEIGINHIRNDETIRLAFWGMIRQPEYFAKVFKVFGNDERFSIDIYGAGYSEEISSTISENGYKNIFLHGKFNQDDIIKFAANTDILLNCYSNNSIQKNALTVKLYEGISFNLPMIVQKDSYMDSYLDEAGVFHFSFDFDNDCELQAYKEEIIDFNFSLGNNSNRRLIEKIQAEDLMFTSFLRNFCS
ncbi:MAG: hypothetical protein ACI4MN_02325 [Candidatus Coproplasma sp.]